MNIKWKMNKKEIKNLNDNSLVELKDLIFDEFCRRNLHLPKQIKEDYKCIGCSKPINPHDYVYDGKCSKCRNIN